MKPVKWFSYEMTKHVRPVIRDYLIQVYEKPENYLEPDQKEGGNQLIKFQMALKKIPNWTNTQIKKQIEEITMRCPGFKKLLVALFVSYIKMISDGIRTSSKSRRLDVKLPSDESFVHTCFIDAAHNLYEDPYIMKEQDPQRERELDRRLQESIMNSINKLIPTMDIINTYIPATSDEVSFSSANDQDEPGATETPAVTTTDTSLMKPTEGGGENEEACEDLKDNEPDEEKVIPATTAGAPAQAPQPVSTTDLFPDAREDKISHQK